MKKMNYEFGLKNFEKTKAKYKNYKPEMVKQFFKENDIKRYLDNLKEEIIYGIEGSNHWITDRIMKHGLTRSDLRMFKTAINGRTYHLNFEFVRSLGIRNKNENKNLTIILYLKNYKRINSIMKSATKGYLKDLNKKRILWRLENEREEI